MDSELRKAMNALGFGAPSQAPTGGEDDHNSLSSHPSTPPPATLSTTSLLSSTSTTSSSQSQNITCSICLAALEPGQGQAIFTAECSHSFHFQCISSNANHGNQVCPVCRAIWINIPFQRAIHTPRSRRYLSMLSQVADPSVFDDDESLDQPDRQDIGASKTVDIRTDTELSCIQRDKSVEDFAVLIHLKTATNDALQQSGSRTPCTPVDLVTVLDISGSMEGSKLALLKRAMAFVIHNLSSNDRLSVVAFSSTSNRLFPLLRMTESGRQKALQAVNSLVADGGTNIAEGLRKGAKVMEERRVKNPVSGIILLSDGQDNYTRYHENGSRGTGVCYELFLPPSLLGDDGTGLRIPVHTFGFGTDHDASLLHSIAEMSRGTFSFIETEAAIQDAFAQCIGGLLSVVVQEVQVRVECIHPGICLTSIKAGSYPTRILGDRRSGFIDVGDLYAEEERDFLVSLSIPIETSGDSTLLLRVKCVHKDPVTKETVTWEGEVMIGRPETVDGEESVSIEVDRQRNRLQATEAMGQARAAAELQGGLDNAVSVLEDFRKRLASSASARAKDQMCVALDDELKEMQQMLSSKRRYEATGRAYILSGISAHSSQRATTRGSSYMDISDDGRSYQTRAMRAMVQRSRDLSTMAGPTKPEQ